MQFKEDAKVLTSNGEEVGRIDRIVIDPRSKDVTHVVVRKGWLFTEDRVIPTALFDEAYTDKIVLVDSVNDLEKFPEYEEIHYVPVNDQDTPYPLGGAQPFYWYPPVTTYGGTVPAFPVILEQSGTQAKKEQKIPEGTVALKEGARVLSANGDNIGNLARGYHGSERRAEGKPYCYL